VHSEEEIGCYLEKSRERLTRLCMNLCKNHHDAEDLFQDTCLRAVKYFKKYDHNTEFEKWIYRICINTYKTSLKKKYIFKQAAFENDEEYSLFIECIPEAERPYDDSYRELLAAVNKLPEKYRTVLVLRYFNDYSEEDTAKLMGIPKGTVKSRLNKAKKLIREVMEFE
jgi:RNA polymerase sigma-70 factor (ECF subfamily)